MSAEQRLADMRGRSGKATAGPWLNGGQGWVFASALVPNDGRSRGMRDLLASVNTADPDAEFIAHARTDLDDLRGAVEDVLALHAEVPLWATDPANGTWIYDENEEKVPLPPVCQECTPRDSLLAMEDGEWNEDIEAIPYPCPTVSAITKRLGGA